MKWRCEVSWHSGRSIRHFIHFQLHTEVSDKSRTVPQQWNNRTSWWNFNVSQTKVGGGERPVELDKSWHDSLQTSIIQLLRLSELNNTWKLNKSRDKQHEIEENGVDRIVRERVRESKWETKRLESPTVSNLYSHWLAFCPFLAQSATENLAANFFFSFSLV